MNFKRCPACAGKGKILRYRHIDNGKCFTCQGSGKVQVVEPEDKPLPTIAGKFPSELTEEDKRNKVQPILIHDDSDYDESQPF